MSEQSHLVWIGVDWGSSFVRLWAFDARGTVIGARSGEQGVLSMAGLRYEDVFAQLAAEWVPTDRPIDVICCGMAGSRGGWEEAPYVPTPAPPPGLAQAVAAPVRREGLRVRLIPGVSQAQPADVMRGEETKVAGFLAQNPDFDGILCLPGTHTKWVHLSAGEIVSFRTFMTGEIFALLVNQSTLTAATSGDGWDAQAFEGAVSEGMSRPQHLASHAFSLRAEHLVSGLAPDVARSRLSGFLIGMELAAARAYWLGQNIAIAGVGSLGDHYARALELQGCVAVVHDVEALTVEGLRRAWLGGQSA